MKTVSLLDSITATHDNFDATANARIKIDGQEEEAKCCVATNPCVEKTLTINRHGAESVLQGHVLDSFVGEINDALVPHSKCRTWIERLNVVSCFLSFALFIGCVALYFLRPDDLGGEITFDSTSPTRCGSDYLDADQECHADCSGTEAGYCASLGYAHCYSNLSPCTTDSEEEGAAEFKAGDFCPGFDASAWCDCSSDCREESCACDGAQGASCCGGDSYSSAPRIPTYYLIAGICVGYMILSSLALYLCTRQYRSRLVTTLTEQCASLSSKHAPTTFKVGWTSPFYFVKGQGSSGDRTRRGSPVYHIDVILPRSSVTSARPVSTEAPLVSEASVPITVEAIPV